MTELTRRQILAGVGAGVASIALGPRLAKAQGARPHVVVVGGGFGGATAANYLMQWGGGGVDVTLIDSRNKHVSCILSNLVLNGQETTRSLTFGFNKLRNRGVQTIRDVVRSIDTAGQSVQLRDGGSLSYDRLVLSPGVAFRKVPGLSYARVPHAWKAGSQTNRLRRQLEAMPNGGTFVMTIPPVPYRCPPGPYERACVVADYVQRNKGGGRVVVLDANADIVAERHTFSSAHNGLYAGTVEYRPGVTLDEVDSDGLVAYTSAGEFEADVLNVIPEHRAPGLLRRAGLLNDASRRWAGVDPLSYESTAARNVHVIGDAQATGQPKAGHIANSEAKICADAILRSFEGIAPDPKPVTNSACYSPITYDTASWLTGVFQYDSASGTMQAVPAAAGEASHPSRDNYKKMYAWSANLFKDTFG